MEGKSLEKEIARLTVRCPSIVQFNTSCCVVHDIARPLIPPFSFVFPPVSLSTQKHLVETLELKNANKLLESELTKQGLQNKLAFQALTHDHQASHLALSNDLRQKEARISELETKLREHEEAIAKHRQGKGKLGSPPQRPNRPRGRAEVRRQQRPVLSSLRVVPHLLAIVLEMVGGKTLLLDVPLVCKEWKAICREEDVSAVMEFKTIGMAALNDYGLVVMLQRFPAASKIDISGKILVPYSPSFHLIDSNNCWFVSLVYFY